MPDMSEIPVGDEQSAKYEPVEGQCGTCGWAADFDYAGCPSGPEDGVHCASESLARALGNWGEWKEMGYIELMRLEVLAEETFRCQHWKPKKGEG